MSQRDVLCGAWGEPNNGLEPPLSSVRSCLAPASSRSSDLALSRQEKLGVACKVQVLVGEGRATHPERVLRPWRSRGRTHDEPDGRSVDRVSWRPQGEPCPLKGWDSCARALVADAEGLHAHRRPYKPSRLGQERQVRRSPQAGAGRQRDVQALGRPRRACARDVSKGGRQRWGHPRGHPDTARGGNGTVAAQRPPGRRRSPGKGNARRRRMGSRIAQSTQREGKPPTRGRTRRKHAARQGHASRTWRTGVRGANRPAGSRQQRVPGNGHLRPGSECNRGTGCGKTARPGLYGGRRVTGVPTVATLLGVRQRDVRAL
jgi:hypothetical protein